MPGMDTLERLDTAPATYADYLAWPESNVPCEVVDGVPIVSPMPSGPHQLAVARIIRALDPAAPQGIEVLPGMDWVLRRDPVLVRQPDVVVVTDRQARAARLTSPPLLAAEVVGPTSRERDLVAKRHEYAAADLPWYWLVDPALPQIVVLRNDGGQLVLHASAVGDERLTVSEPLAVGLRPSELH